jgi:hypothetical protein
MLEVLFSLATSQSSSRTTCVVVPDADGVAETVACLAALQLLASDWPNIEKSALDKEYADGAALRSVSDGRIFIYRGRDPSGNFIKLQYTDRNGLETSGTFTKPRNMILQFEPTSRKRPISTSGSGVKPPTHTFYDLVCDSSTCGNSSLIWNRVVLLGYASDFEAALSSMELTLSEGNGRPPVLKDFAWGTLTEDGQTIITKPLGGLGEPLVAVTRDPFLLKPLSNFSGSPSRQRLLVSSRIELVLAHFDAIQTFAERNRVLLVASGAQRDNARKLRDLGWAVWEPTGSVLPVAKPNRVPQSVRGLAASERALTLDMHVGNALRMQVKDPFVSRLFQSFSDVGSAIPLEDGTSEPLLAGFADALNDVFFNIASWLRVPEPTSSEWYASAKLQLGRSRGLLIQVAGAAAAASLDQFLATVDEYERSHSVGMVTMKGKEILRIVDLAVANESLKHRFVCSSLRARDETTAFFASVGRKVACCTIQQMRAEDDVFRVVPISIFNRQKFARLLDPWPANQLMLVGYDFELDIYGRRLAGRLKSRAGLSLSAKESSAMTGLPETFFRIPIAAVVPISSNSTGDHSSNDKLVDLEVDGLNRLVKARRPSPSLNEADSTIPANVVNFAKNSWAALSPEHLVLAIGTDTAGTAIQLRRTVDLADGSRLVMRESGSKDVVREIAEELAGQEQYRSLRHVASLWQRALVASAQEPLEVGRRLSEFGVSRSQMTIRGWLRDKSYIGPKSGDDVLAIAEAFPVKGATDADWQRCADAITRVRGLHLNAGVELTRMLGATASEHLFESPDHELPVQTPKGRFWILEVAEIDRIASHWPAGEVNRLGWYDNAARARIEKLYLDRPEG